ncbi:monocarboxylate transporter 9-like [Musca vetustissima]|uniref:monocarboxylate transporter 9-like n=1 Tax=Musca vetustissima TaxID=27455 RepID=UPI002AB7DECA|nr:monocarboxylate transporter 9-like [Musca vetustissima]
MDRDKQNEANNSSVYKATTVSQKPKRPDRSDLGPNFVAPDGGWGWVVCIAAGLSNLSLFPPQHQYGLIYRQRMEKSGFNAKQISTIVNSELALSSLVGLVNGAMFRRFTFRQVALMGSLLAFVGIFCSAFCENFLQYLLSFSTIYGIGLGLCCQANALALNTYFKNKRRKATGFSWTITGLGSVIFPQITIILFAHYGVQGAILVYSGIMLNAFMCSLTLQPVLWHSPKSKEDQILTNDDRGNCEEEDVVFKCQYCRDQEILEEKELKFEKAESLTMAQENNEGRERKSSRKNCENDGNQMKENQDGTLPTISNQTNNNSQSIKIASTSCTCAEEKLLLERRPEKYTFNIEEEEGSRKKSSFTQKVILFFDLDLLKDLTFVNLALGMAIMMFGEINFSVLTPFILNNFGYTDKQISVAMSCLGIMDIAVRFLSPFVLEKVKLSNSVLFAIGIITVSLGRWIVTLTDSYHIVLMVFILIGFGKGFRIIFSPLIIPSYVPLKRLPAASGLQLIFSSITSFTLGPLLGLITDNYGYAITIHCINALTCLMLLFWLMEYLIRRRKSTLNNNISLVHLYISIKLFNEREDLDEQLDQKKIDERPQQKELNERK